MTPPEPIIIDCHYTGRPEVAAAFLLQDGERVAFIETNTAHALPRLLSALKDAGRTPEQVDWVIVTHAHLDHSGGAWALMEVCPNAVLIVHPRAAPHLIDPAKLIRSAAAIYGDEVFKELYGAIEGVPEDRVRVVADGERIAFGARELEFIFTPGHASHHICVHDAAAQTIYTGDSFGIIYPQLQSEGRFAFPSTPPTDFDADAALESLDRILATGAKRALVTHFGGYTDLETIAPMLRAQLEQLGAWVDEGFASEMEGDALDAHYDAKVRAMFDALLTKHGMAKGDPRRGMFELDIMLNAQGLAFAVKKRRYKARKAASS